MRGLPQTVSALTTASTDDVLAVLFVEADECPAGEIMRRMLAQFAWYACCVFDPATGRIIGTTDADTRTAILGAWAADTGGSLVVKPKPPVTGINTLWQVDSDTLGDAALSDLLANDYQRRGFNGLVNTGLSYFRVAPPGVSVFPAVLVDQTSAEVRFLVTDGSLTTALAALTPAGQTVCVQFAEPKPKLAFE
jgi:hypothetical protein